MVGQLKTNELESSTTEGDSPVGVRLAVQAGILSRAGPVKPCPNPPAPSGKANYGS